MGQEEEERQDPAVLRELARRVRVVASAHRDSERCRLLDFADELDALASKLEGAGAP